MSDEWDWPLSLIFLYKIIVLQLISHQSTISFFINFIDIKLNINIGEKTCYLTFM